MRKKSTLICMLLCMYLNPVLANEISSVKKNVSASYLAWHAPDLEVIDIYPEEIVLVFTDNSNDDVGYSLSRKEEGSTTWEWLFDFNAPDSGSVSYFQDQPLKPGTQYTYSVSVTLQDGSTLTDVATVSATTSIDPPIIKYDDMYWYDCGSEIPIQIDYPTEGAYTEIYHSLSATGQYR